MKKTALILAGIAMTSLALAQLSKYKDWPKSPEAYFLTPAEREGLLRPGRTEGNTRLYDSDTIERLEIILTLTRDLGVNLAGVEVILHMKEKIERMQGDVHHLFSVLREEVEARRVEPDRRYALTTVSKSLALAKLDKR